MRAQNQSKAEENRKPGIVQRFKAELAREDLRLWTASFSDRELEEAYQRHLVNVDLPKIRYIGISGVIVWYLFGVLDFLTIRDNLVEILVLRTLIAGPIVTLLAAQFFNERLKRHYAMLLAVGMLVFSFAILAMIQLMPTDGAPPYIIGVLVIFAYSSCFNRMAFPLAAAVYMVTSFAYALMLHFGGKFSDVDIISGQFFMFNIATIAVVTHYAQEIRSRQIWRRNRQRALDAAYIEELLIEATAADQSKINFISILSHELRTPLHQIIGFSEVVRQQLTGEPKPDTKGFVEDIHSSAHSLLSRIGKMLRYADATAGKIRYEKEKISAGDLIETVIVQAEDKAEGKSVTFDTSELSDDLMFIDHHHTSYAVSHLVENAIKASHRGSVITFKGRSQEDGGYQLDIIDHGVGMDADQLKAAFEPFSQLEQVRTRSREGLGLGLTLARKIFHDQNAEMTIRSEKDNGTTVAIRFAAQPAKPEALAKSA